MSHSVSQRYSKALMALAQNEKDIEKFLKDLSGIAKIFDETEAVRQTLSDPQIKKQQKIEIVSELSSKVGCHPLVINLLKLMIQKNRMETISDLSRHFEKLAHEALGIAKATFIFAGKPEEKTKSELCATLEKAMSKKIIPSYEIDPDILDGVIVRVGSLEIDGSVQNYFKQIHSKIEKLNINQT